MTLCSEDDVGVPTSSSMTLLGQFSAKTCSEEDVSIPTSSSTTLSKQIPANLRSEEDVSTPTLSSVTHSRKIPVNFVQRGRCQHPHVVFGKTFQRKHVARKTWAPLRCPRSVMPGMPEQIGHDEEHVGHCLRNCTGSQGPKVGRRDGPLNRPGHGFCEPADALYSAGDLTMAST